MMLITHLPPNNLASAMDMMRSRDSTNTKLKNITMLLLDLAMFFCSFCYRWKLPLIGMLLPQTLLFID